MKTLMRWILYLVGMVVLALGLSLNTMTELGTSPITALAYCVSKLWALNFGDMLFLLYSLFVVAQFVLRGRNSHLYDLLQLPLSLVFSRVMNLLMTQIPYRGPEHSLALNLAVLVLAICLTGVGVALTVNMRLIPNPGDGIVQAVAEKIGRGQGFAKNIFDVGCVTVTCVLGLCVQGNLSGLGIGIGTLAAMVGVGRSIALVNHFWKKKMCAAAGVAL